MIKVPEHNSKMVRSIEGRVGVYHLVDAQQSMNLTFKSNREGSDMYCLNSLNFHPSQIPNKETNDRTTTKNPRATEGGCCCNINNFNGGTNRNNNPSSSSSSRIAVARIAKHETLDLVRCQSCETYMMLKSEADVCPICNGGLVLFERERCFYYND